LGEDDADDESGDAGDVSGPTAQDNEEFSDQGEPGSDEGGDQQQGSQRRSGASSSTGGSRPPSPGRGPAPGSTDPMFRDIFEGMARKHLERLDQLPPDVGGRIKELRDYDFME